MLVKCSKSFRHQTTEGNIYLVIEILINIIQKRLSYRIIDNEGSPVIYESNDFEVFSRNLDGYCLTVEIDYGVRITHKLILDSKLNVGHIDGFWGIYFNSANNEGKDLLENVIKDLSYREKIPAPALERD